MKNKRLLIIYFLLSVSIFVSCNKPEIIVYNKNKLHKIKVIKFRKIKINTLNFDPFIKNDIENILEFKLNQAGYVVKKEVSTNEQINYDAYLDFYLSHRKFFKGVDESENLTIDLKLYDITDKKICLMFFTDIEEDDILNTDRLKEYISEMIEKIKEFE